jgi:transposase-like protein
MIPTGGADMKCPRCEGRMFSERYYDFVRSFDAWKCTCCGEVIDPTILSNRARNVDLFLG